MHSAFFIVQLSHPYMITEKTIALTIWIFVGKIMSLFFNMLSSLVIAFLPGKSFSYKSLTILYISVISSVMSSLLFLVLSSLFSVSLAKDLSILLI